MTSFWRPVTRLATLAAVAALLAGGSSAWAVVTLTADPALPDFPDVVTVNPYLGSGGARGITEGRNLRQTFKNPTTIDVGEIVLSFNVDAGGVGGMILEFYEVDDVNAAAWTAGSLVHTISLPTTLDTTEFFGVTLTDADVFTLPARFAGTTGYGLEVSNFDGASTIGTFRHTNTGVDEYVDGVFYVEDGTPSGGSSANRDVWLSLVDANAAPSTPGDVDGDGDVDFIETDNDMISDLDIIAANFRQGGALRTDGDLTGDGFVDLRDFREWKANFPQALPASFQFGLAVPEPASLMAALATVAACGVMRRRG
ncbi:MAG: hypothetical protein KDA37_06425 [Planctomycetales bacterium]|nr:hypothetical protein [Planctomycetales bacterium]